MLNNRSRQIRRDTIALSKANGGYHYGGSFSCVEILIALFDNVMDLNVDRFILSKGHACWPYYVLLREMGLNPKLGGHPERDPYNGILCSTGSLGHGFPTAVGIALAKNLKQEAGRVFVLMGDGECQAGTTWESMLIAKKLMLSNLVVIVDWNGIQGSAHCSEVLPTLTIDSLFFVADRLGWDTFFENGHNIEDLVDRFRYAPNVGPSLVIASTIKGKGVSFMENQPKWHSNWLSPDLEKQALEELS